MWYYMQGPTRCGPVTTSAVPGLVTSGIIGPGTLVWRAGLAAWVPAGSTELAHVLSAAGSATAVAPAPKSFSRLWTWYFWLGVCAWVPLLGVVAFPVSASLGLRLLHRCWTLVKSEGTSPTPGAAVGLYFVPVFNLGWGFIAVVRLATAMNHRCDSRGAGGLRVSKGLAISATVLGSLAAILMATFLFLLALNGVLPADKRFEWWIFIVPLSVFLAAQVTTWILARQCALVAEQIVAQSAAPRAGSPAPTARGPAARRQV